MVGQNPSFVRHGDSLRLRAEEGKLALLGIKPHQCFDNFFHHQELILRIASIECAAFDPRGLALPPQCQFTLGFRNLFSK